MKTVKMLVTQSQAWSKYKAVYSETTTKLQWEGGDPYSLKVINCER